MSRSWQRDLDRGVDNELTRRIHAHEVARSAAIGIDIAQYVREALDGAIADLDLPATFARPAFGDAGTDGLTNAQRPVWTQLERALVARIGRGLSTVERTKTLIAFVSDWLRRARAVQQEAESAPMVSSPVPGSEASFYTSDGRYFFHERDRRAHQKLLDERAERHAARVRARVGAGMVA